MLGAGVESWTSPVEMEVDSRVRILAWGCGWNNPGGLPISLPPSFEWGERINMIKLRKQSAARNIVEVRVICVLYVQEKLTNQISVT